MRGAPLFHDGSGSAFGTVSSAGTAQPATTSTIASIATRVINGPLTRHRAPVASAATQRDPGAAPFLALDLEGATVRFGDASAQVEAETEAPGVATAGRVGAIERLSRTIDLLR